MLRATSFMPMVPSQTRLLCLVPLVREAPAVYRPRRPEKTAFYRLLEAHFEKFALAHEERFERKDGPLRPVVRKAVDAFLAYGRPENGFARVRCPECRSEYLVPFSCQTRNFCPSCQQKRALLFAGKLREEVLAPVHHTHCIFTIPVALRRLFLRERRLLGLLPRCAFETVRRCFRAALGCHEGVPGMVAAIQTLRCSGPLPLRGSGARPSGIPTSTACCPTASSSGAATRPLWVSLRARFPR